MFTGIEAEMARLRKEVDKFEQEAVDEVKATARTLFEELVSRTPVWEGTTVRNFNFATRGFSGATASAIGGAPPGPTNIMAIGSEPRRAANEAAARSAMEAALSFKKLMSIYVNNTAPNAALVDAGEAPGGPNQKIRNPGGVSALALQSTRNSRKHWK